MIKRIEDILKNKKKDWSFFEYSITYFQGESYQKLYEQEGASEKKLMCHQDRCVQENSYDVTIWLSQTKDQWGVVHFDIVLDSGQATCDSVLEEQIDRAIQMAEYSKSPSWTLDKDICRDKELHCEVETFCAEIYENPASILDQLEKKLIEDLARRPESFIACSAEIYVNKKSVYFKNSFNFEHSFKKTSFYVELALSDKSDSRQEVLEYQTGLSVQDVRLGDFIAGCIQQVTSLGRTIVPSTSQAVSILIHMKYFSDIIDAVEDQLVSFREYQKYPHLKEGDTIYAQERKGDPFDLSVDPFLSMMSCSLSFIGNGVLPRQGCLIQDGIVKNRMVGVRESDYLSLEPNYFTGNTLIPSGQNTYDQLCMMEDDLIEIISFSSLLVDDNTLTWSSEIKLAYLRRKGKIVQMLKGGVLSGDIRKNLSHCFYSNDVMRYNRIADAYHSAIGYVGPQYALFKEGVSLSGK